MRRFAAAWRFLTAFPFPLPPGTDEGALLGRSAGMFPLVGVLLGLLAAGGAAALGTVLPSVTVAALGVAGLALFSLGLHLDGLADCADALFSPGRDREAALAIMKDSRIGAHGAMGLVLVLLIKFAALAPLEAGIIAAALFLAPVGGRVAMLFPMALLPYARDKGLGSVFTIRRPAATLIRACLVLAFAGSLALGPGGALRLLAWVLSAAFLWTGYLRRRLGGGTGDTYGAACELGEMAALLAVSGL